MLSVSAACDASAQQLRLALARSANDVSRHGRKPS